MRRSGDIGGIAREGIGESKREEKREEKRKARRRCVGSVVVEKGELAICVSCSCFEFSFIFNETCEKWGMDARFMSLWWDCDDAVVTV